LRSASPRRGRLLEGIRRFAQRHPSASDKSFELLKQNPKHPSLHFKRIGTRWSPRVGIGYRALALEIDGGFLWYWIGSHADYERLIN
jgi:hypothetical protein